MCLAGGEPRCACDPSFSGNALQALSCWPAVELLLVSALFYSVCAMCLGAWQRSYEGGVVAQLLTTPARGARITLVSGPALKDGRSRRPSIFQGRSPNAHRGIPGETTTLNRPVFMKLPTTTTATSRFQFENYHNRCRAGNYHNRRRDENYHFGISTRALAHRDFELDTSTSRCRP